MKAWMMSSVVGLALAGQSSFANPMNYNHPSPWAKGATGECYEDKCILHKVTIKLRSYLETPIYLGTNSLASVNGTRYDFGTVVSHAGDECSKTVIVPKMTYDAIQYTMFSIANPGYEPEPELTATQQTMMLFYITMAQQTQNFECEPRDLEATLLDVPRRDPTNGVETADFEKRRFVGGVEQERREGSIIRTGQD